LQTSASETNGVLNYAFDPNGGTLTVTAVNGNTAAIGQQITLGSGSTLTMQADGNFTYTPRAGGAFNETFTVTVSNGSESVTGNVFIDVGSPENTTGKRVIGLVSNLRQTNFDVPVSNKSFGSHLFVSDTSTTRAEARGELEGFNAQARLIMAGTTLTDLQYERLLVYYLSLPSAAGNFRLISDAVEKAFEEGDRGMLRAFQLSLATTSLTFQQQQSLFGLAATAPGRLTAEQLGIVVSYQVRPTGVGGVDGNLLVSLESRIAQLYGLSRKLADNDPKLLIVAQAMQDVISLQFRVHEVFRGDINWGRVWLNRVLARVRGPQNDLDGRFILLELNLSDARFQQGLQSYRQLLITDRPLAIAMLPLIIDNLLFLAGTPGASEARRAAAVSRALLVLRLVPTLDVKNYFQNVAMRERGYNRLQPAIHRQPGFAKYVNVRLVLLDQYLVELPFDPQKSALENSLDQLLDLQTTANLAPIREAEARARRQRDQRVVNMNPAERLWEAVQMAVALVPEDIANRILAIFTPENIPAMVLMFAAGLVPVLGEFAILTAMTIGLIRDVRALLSGILDALTAQTHSGLEYAAIQIAQGVGGITVDIGTAYVTNLLTRGIRARIRARLGQQFPALVLRWRLPPKFFSLS
jgi:hypothetical protein